MRALLALGCGALLGCSDPAPPADVDAGEVAYALSIRPLGGPDAGIELRQGFQGFRYTRVVLVAEGSVPSQTPGTARLEIDGFDPAEQRFRAIVFQERARGYFESEPLLVYTNDITPSRAVGRHATLRFDLQDGRRRGSARLEGPVGWDPDCVEDADYRCQPAPPTDAGAP